MTIIRGGSWLWVVILLTTWAAHPTVNAQQRLGYWKFDRPDFRGEQGQMPLVCTNVALVPSFDGSAAAINITNTGAILQYRTVETNGHTNLNTTRGAVRLWFKPAWSSMNEGGKGPGITARLIEIGQWTPPPCRGGFWCIHIAPDGCQIGFSAQTNGSGNTFVTHPIRWKSNTWHQVVLSYSPEYTRLEIDGQMPSFGGGLNINPSPEVLAQGFRIGSDANGNQSAQGTVDELETFDAPLSPIATWQKEVMLSARARSTPPALLLSWQTDANLAPTIKRRELSSPNWITLAEHASGSEYTDESITPGRIYEYQIPHPSPWGPVIGSRAIQAVCDGVPTENRGNVILLVDQTMASPLCDALNRLNDDLVGDGWHVWRHDVPRHDDTEWAQNTNHIARIKKSIQEDFATAPESNWTLFIIGHVAIPYSGQVNPDGHYARPWATDGYYADTLHPNAWTDRYNRPGKGDNIPNSPGDGKFDSDIYPGPVAMSFGRVDFWKMPAFTSKATNDMVKRTETDMVRDYLNRDHQYRHGQLSFQPKAMAKGKYFPIGKGRNPWFPLNTLPYMNAIRAASAWFEPAAGRLVDGDFFLTQTPLLCGFQAGYGGPSAVDSMSSEERNSRDLANPNRQPPVAFAFLDGSMMGQMDYEDCLLRAFLGNSKGGLGSVWMRGYVLHSEVAGLGAPVGEIVRHTLNDTTMFRNGGPLYISWMGDPTLRLQITDPPHALKASKDDQRVELKWSESQAPHAQYHVYRAADMSGTFTRLTPTPLVSTQFLDAFAPKGRKFYQVRTLERVTTGCGSFTNLSQGVFVSVK